MSFGGDARTTLGPILPILLLGSVFDANSLGKRVTIRIIIHLSPHLWLAPTGDNRDHPGSGTG